MKYATVRKDRNLDNNKYHDDEGCPRLPDEHRKCEEWEIEKWNIQPCSYCAGGWQPAKIEGLWDDE